MTRHMLYLALAIALLPALAGAAPSALTDHEMAGVTGQQGIEDRQNPNLASSAPKPEATLLPMLFSNEQNQLLSEELRRARDLYQMGKTAHEVVEIHQNLFTAPKAVQTILSVPATIGGFFF